MLDWYADQSLTVRVLVLIAALIVIAMIAFGIQRGLS
jgi:hypothetical protein